MSFWDVVGYGIVSVIGVWIAARLIFSAYFLTKQQHEKRKHHHG